MNVKDLWTFGYYDVKEAAGKLSEELRECNSGCDVHFTLRAALVKAFELGAAGKKLRSRDAGI